MNSIILCEGIDEVYIIGYYAHKTSGRKWVFEDKAEISKEFNLAKQIKDNQCLAVYKNAKDQLAIWSVGGKDSFTKPLDSIFAINKMHPDERFEEIVIIMDRDSDEISDILKSIEMMVNNNKENKTLGITVSLNNNSQNKFGYSINDTEYHCNITPIILPFDEPGAIENVLMTAIAEESGEDAFIVENAKRYIDDLVIGKKIQKYLKRDMSNVRQEAAFCRRKVLKSKFSSVISITNPDRSTALFNMLLMSHSWEEKPEVKKHFGLLDSILYLK